jgi:putative inorganic carbon (hco3(-)) transporter
MTVWQQITLSHLYPYQWRSASFLYRAIGGSLQSWRSGSWALQWAEPIGAWLLAVLFTFSPFVPTSLIGVILLACAAFWVILTVSDDSRMGFTPIHLLVLLYWGVVTIATALSPVKQAAMVGWGKLTLYLLLFALCAKILRSPRVRSWLINIYLHIALIVSIYGLRQCIFGVEELATWTDPTSSLAGLTRAYSYLGNPNLLASYLLPAVFLSIAAFFSWRGRWPKLLAVTLTIVNTSCLVLTYSRGGWIGLVAGGLVMMMLLLYWWSAKLPPEQQKQVILSVLGGLAAVMVLTVLFVPAVRTRVMSMFIGREDSSNNFRLNVWAAVGEMIRDRPILGIGPGNTAFNKIYPLYMRPKYSALSAYSVLLEILVESGIIGFSCFVWLMLVTFSQGWTQLQRLRAIDSREAYWLMAAIASLCSMLAHGFVDTVWFRPEVSTLWWFSMAMIASYFVPPEEASSNNV